MAFGMWPSAVGRLSRHIRTIPSVRAHRSSPEQALGASVPLHCILRGHEKAPRLTGQHEGARIQAARLPGGNVTQPVCHQSESRRVRRNNTPITDSMRPRWVCFFMGFPPLRWPHLLCSSQLASSARSRRRRRQRYAPPHEASCRTAPARLPRRLARRSACAL